MHRCRVWAGGFAPEITHQRGQKSTFTCGNGGKAKIVPHVTLGFPEYGMSAILVGGFPMLPTRKGDKRVTYLMEWRLCNGMMRRKKNMSNVPAWYPEYGMTNTSNFRQGLPPANKSKKLIKGGVYLMERRQC